MLVLYPVSVWIAIVRNWPLRMGLGMLLVGMLLLWWQAIAAEPGPRIPGMGIAMLVVLVPPVIVITWGLIAAVRRYRRR